LHTDVLQTNKGYLNASFYNAGMSVEFLITLLRLKQFIKLNRFLRYRKSYLRLSFHVQKKYIYIFVWKYNKESAKNLKLKKVLSKMGALVEMEIQYQYLR